MLMNSLYLSTQDGFNRHSIALLRRKETVIIFGIKLTQNGRFNILLQSRTKKAQIEYTDH